MPATDSNALRCLPRPRTAPGCGVLCRWQGRAARQQPLPANGRPTRRQRAPPPPRRAADFPFGAFALCQPWRSTGIPSPTGRSCRNPSARAPAPCSMPDRFRYTSRARTLRCAAVCGSGRDTHRSNKE